MDVLTSSDGHICTITLNRPPINFLDDVFVQNIAQALQAAYDNPQCRVIILTHAGKCFSGGADFAAQGDGIDIAGVRKFYNSVIEFFSASKPIVAAIEGPAIGAGLGLALVADFRVASKNARFSANFVRLGIHPGFAIDHLLPKVVGQQAAKKLLYTGARINGQDAHAIGLVDELVSEGEALERAQGLAEELAMAAPQALQDLHFTLRQGLQDEVRQALDRSLASQTLSFQSSDFREGVKAAAERRDPEFSGISSG